MSITSQHYGHIRHPETGECVASVKDGKISGLNGSSYRLDGDAIVSESGDILGYLSPFIGIAQGSRDLATQLFVRGG